MKWDMVEPLESESLIDEFEELCGYKFPASFRECIIKNNGGKPEFDVFDTVVEEGRAFHFLFSFNKTGQGYPIGKAVEAWKIHLDDAIYSGDPEEIAVCETILNRYISFADTPCGDYIAIDKVNDSIVLICHETYETEHIADSFDEFLDCLYPDEDD